jgi:hypothetical protein
MDRSLLMIAALIFVVGAVGFMTVSDSWRGDVTGNVILEQENTCGSCQGTWVCAAKAGKVYNYPSACDAQCDNAKVIYDAVCERIPHAQK